MTLGKLTELFAAGKQDTDIAQIMVDAGLAESHSNTRKGVGLIRKILENGQSDEALILTRQNKSADGEVTSEVYSRRAVNGASIPDNMRLKGISKAPSGSQWEIWRADMDDSGAILKEELTKAVKPLSIKYTKAAPTGDMALEIMLTDHHFGKIPYSYKAEDWSLENSKAEYLKAIEFHVSKAPKEVSTLILPIGNDLLHINSNTGSTKKGTPMEYSANYHHLYAFVRDCVAGSIVSLSKRFNIKVVIVPGNHDEDACYRLGDYLEGLFDGNDRVDVNNTGHDRKYIQWGDSIIMWTHGEKVKLEKLHDSFSVDVPQMNALAKYRYVHTGHLHKNQRIDTFRKTMKDEYLGTEAEVCPSLSPTDNWHFENMYTGGQRRCKAFLYALKGGKTDEWYYSI